MLCLLPAPEAALLLDDWVASRGATLSPALRELVLALGRLDFGAASRLSFAQTLAAGEATQGGSLAGALVRWRNARALQEVERARAAGCERIALLYGALHMRDLRAKLQGKYRLVSVGEPEWVTAWAIPLPAAGGAAAGAVGAPDEEVEAAESPVTPRELVFPAAALLALLTVDGSDWLELVRTLATAVGTAAAAILGDDLSLPSSVTAGGASGPEAALAAVLYLGRHALLYLALQRWAFQWDARWWAVESDQ